MKGSRILAVALRQAYLMRGSLSRVLPLFLWVLIDMVLWGFITRFLNRVSGSQMDFVPAMLGAVLLWDFFIRVMQGVTTAFLEDVWSRNFLNIFATPLKTTEYLAGLILTSVSASMVSLGAMLLFATTVFGLSFIAYGYLLVPFLMSLFLMGIALGILACAMVLRLGPSAEWFVWPIPAVLAPFAGVFYPIETLPNWMQVIAKVVPASYVFEGMRDVLAQGQSSLSLTTTALGLAALYVAVSAWVFHQVFRSAVKSGLLARYSAESVS